MLKRLSSLTFSLLTALAAVVGFFQLLQPVQAADLIVNPGESIQAAIDVAGAGDTIIIQAGSYTESLTLNKAISLTGVSSDTVILHAEPNSRVLTVTGAVIDHQVVISGLTFTGGNLDLFNQCPSCGGGILITGTARPFIQSVTFISNTAGEGAAIYAHENSPLALDRVEVVGNSFQGVVAQDRLTVTHSSFIENAIYDVIAYDSLYVDETRFVDGVLGILALAPATVYNSYFENATISTTAHILVTGSQFISNTATALRATSATIAHSYFAHTDTPDQTSGAIYTVGSLTLTYSTLIDNYGHIGGGVFAGGDMHVVSSHFEENKAGLGGAIVSGYGSIFISDTQIIKNIGGIGGGIYIAYDSENPRSLHLINSQISDTVKAFGMFVTIPTWIINSQIVNNEQGGVVVEADAYITNSLIAGHDYAWYGGLYIAGDLTMHHSSILSNAMRAGENGGGAYVGGKASISDSLFQNNHCVDSCFEGGGLFAREGMTLSNSIFMSNTAVVAGGASSPFGSTYITNSHFIDNSADFRVGGVAVRDAQVFNSTVVGNHADQWTGGMYVREGTLSNVFLKNNSAEDVGSSLTIGFSAVEASHLTIIQDASDGNAAVFLQDQNNSLILFNSIISSVVGIESLGTVTEDYNLYVSPTTIFTGMITNGDHSLFGQDPLFVDPAAGNYRLQNGSPAIDAAVDLGILFDLDGRPRPLGDAPDIGAYESGRVTPIISLSSADYSVTENQNALITLTLDTAYTDTVAVDLTTADLSATSGSDYVPISQTVIFTTGVTTQAVTIPILDDLLVENDETLQITLSNPQNGRLVGISEAVLTIKDNDTPPPAPLPTINFSADSYTTTEGAASLLITITLDITSTEAVSVQLATIDFSAVAGSDYTAVSETVVFPAGTTIQTVTIPILDDTAVEGAETFQLVLSDPQNGVLGLNSTAVVTILNDDDPLELPEFVLYLPLVVSPK